MAWREHLICSIALALGKHSVASSSQAQYCFVRVLGVDCSCFHFTEFCIDFCCYDSVNIFFYYITYIISYFLSLLHFSVFTFINLFILRGPLKFLLTIGLLIVQRRVLWVKMVQRRVKLMLEKFYSEFGLIILWVFFCN